MITHDIVYDIIYCVRGEINFLGKYDSIKEKIMKTPTAKDISPEKLQSFLKHFGFVIKRTKGSHYIYEYKDTGRCFIIPIPMHDPINPAYIDQIRGIIIDIEGEQNE